MNTFKIIGALLLTGILATACVQKEHPKTVTFTVDMQDTEILGVVGFRGDFPASNWRETIPMQDLNQDGIYEVTLQDTTAVSRVSFKFVNGTTYELQGLDNRVLTLDYRPETIRYEAIFNKSKGNQTSKDK